MKGSPNAGILRASVLLCALLFVAAHCSGQAAGAKETKVADRAKVAEKAEVSALMVSDIHFEPFWDPAKAPQLAAAPASGWKAILAGPESPDRAQRFAQLQQTCRARGMDTSYPLFASSLRAMRSDARGVRFVTLSGDLIAHSFSCKYAALFPKSTPAAYRAFVEKTLAFVLDSLRGALPEVPVYAALGNNDSDCGDYQLDAHSDFLAASGKIFAADFPESERRAAMEDFAAGGYYDAALPEPMQHTRMLVLDDLFMARGYATCTGNPDPTAADTQIAWLRQQLERARREREKVWVMAHIPTGVDPYSTAMKLKNICAGNSPQMFLSSEALAETLADFSDVVRLAIFAHTHMDELRLLEPAKSSEGHGAVAVKMVASISPVDGNDPSFTVAQIDPATATLMDYRVFAASNQTGIHTTWAEEYNYGQAYREPSFSAASVAGLIAEFKDDPAAQSEQSESYLRNYFVGDVSRGLKPFWPQYVCALANPTEDAYRACVCAKAP